ncbi:hydrogenase expression/formation C-terminal domain-containing protein [Phaeospirillum tilakii]|uniref:Hydrogenase expression/formation C-terminal domain-containing protein n=1 Tax=Phaeospirillum tilakii TaxID=741673 RepID=A0ABW5C8E5_9PROT
MTFDRPLALLASADGARLAAACPRIATLLPRLADALEGGASERFPLPADLDATERALLDDITGRGEVIARIRRPDGRRIEAEEAVMAGLWRLRISDADGQMVGEALDVGPVPGDLLPAVAPLPPLTLPAAAPDGAESGHALLAEIAHAAAHWQPGQPNYALTVAPPVMPDPAVGWLRDQLGQGPVELAVRGESGDCHVAATACRGVWSVRYRNGAGKIQLDAIEIGAVPETVCAAAEDRRDSALRLREIASAYFA